MIEWTPVSGSDRIVAEAYDPDAETINVRFPDGVEWYYAACPPDTWECPASRNPHALARWRWCADGL